MTLEGAPGDAGAAARLGAEIRRIRRARSLTLVELGTRTELSHAFLSQLERGIVQPSLPSLRRIALALETSPIELIAASEAAPPSGSPFEVQRAGTGAVPASFSAGMARMLARAPARFHPMEVDVERSDPGDAFRHEEGEFLYVVAGEVAVELDGVEHRLAPGDSAYVGGGIPHRWWSHQAPARLVVVKEARGR
ncbi:cupin domain-containing protein [Microbacterium excoecariae]|uniref:cupin domain-containing protein n=1 Tax=Microbacterium excoecariae TaxID=2715210 RepID=UPI00140D1A80|nr:helix-turn-helix domain-containing protein [Microbacterium excoecariae]